MLDLAIRVVLSLGLVLCLLGVVAKLSARRLGGGPRSMVRVLGRQALGRNASVAVLGVGERTLVVGVTDTGVRLLTELDPEELPERVAEVVTEPAALPAAKPGRSAEYVPRHAASRSAARTARPRGAAERPVRPAASLEGSLLATQTWREAWAAAAGRKEPAA